MLVIANSNSLGAGGFSESATLVLNEKSLCLNITSAVSSVLHGAALAKGRACNVYLSAFLMKMNFWETLESARFLNFINRTPIDTWQEEGLGRLIMSPLNQKAISLGEILTGGGLFGFP